MFFPQLIGRKGETKKENLKKREFLALGFYDHENKENI